MRTLNKVVVVGRVGRDPEMRISAGGVKWGVLSVATNRARKDGDSWIEETDWHNVKVFSKDAEYAEKNIKRGALVYVDGSVQYDRWTTKEGEKRTSTRILADRIGILQMPVTKPVDVDAQPMPTAMEDGEFPASESSNEPVEAVAEAK